MSGRRHAVRQVRHRRRAVFSGCVALLVVMVAVMVAVVAIRDHRGVTSSQAPRRAVVAANSPMSSAQGSERDFVPDACGTLSDSISARLAPGADRSEIAHSKEADRHSECAWGLYRSSVRTRQLSVELRAIASSGGISATDAAVTTFQNEWQSDRDGKNLTTSVKVRDKRGVTGVGEQAYVVYTSDGTNEIGEAVANARLANVLVTVHYSGRDSHDVDGVPLPSHVATDGALSAARDVISKLESQT